MNVAKQLIREINVLTVFFIRQIFFITSIAAPNIIVIRVNDGSCHIISVLIKLSVSTILYFKQLFQLFYCANIKDGFIGQLFGVSVVSFVFPANFQVNEWN